MTPEGAVKKRGRILCMDLSDVFPIYWFSVNQGKFGRVGIPDDVLCVNGRFVFIEYKAKMDWLSRTASAYKTLPTMAQCRALYGCNCAGGVPLVIDAATVEQLPDIIYEIANGLDFRAYKTWCWKPHDYYKYLNNEGDLWWPSGTPGIGLPRYKEEGNESEV